MANPIKSVLFALNLTEYSRSFFIYAASLAVQIKARAVFLHIREELQENYQGIAVGIFGADQWREILLENRRKQTPDMDSEKLIISAILKQLSLEAEKQVDGFINLKKELIVEKGDVVRGIISQMKKQDCDLVVLGASKKETAEFMIGPYAKLLVRKTKIPIALIPFPVHT